jgi:Recombinase zinc beta ribbon domain/ABC transporter substrate binding protein/Recombinase
MLMNRAAFVVTLALGVLAAPIVLGAQQTGKVYRIGVLSPGAPPPGPLEAFREGLRDFGYMEGRTIVIEWRFAEGKNERLSGLAEELVRLKVDVIFKVNTPAAWAAKKATMTIPIVIARQQDPKGRQACRTPGRAAHEVRSGDQPQDRQDRGQIVYGKTRWQDKGGTRIKVDVPEAKWLRLEAPELRIISEDLWEAAHARMAATHAVYLRRTNGQLGGKPESGLESRYLMSGFLRCGICRGAMQVNKRATQPGRPPLVYVCGTHRTRGNGACPEGHSLSAPKIHEAVVGAMRKVLTPENLETLLRTWAEHRPDHEAKCRATQEDLARVEAELKRLADAVARGAAVQTLLDGIKAREADRRGLLAQLEHLDGLTKAAASFDSEAHLAELKTVLTGWHEALTVAGPAGRQYLRSLLRGPVYVTRDKSGSWHYEGQGALGNVFRGWLGIFRVPAAEIDAMNEMADEFNAKSAQAPESSEAEADCNSVWCREGDRTSMSSRSKVFEFLVRPGTIGNHRSRLEHLQQLGCLDVVAHLAHGVVWKLMVLAQN